MPFTADQPPTGGSNAFKPMTLMPETFAFIDDDNEDDEQMDKDEEPEPEFKESEAMNFDENEEEENEEDDDDEDEQELDPVSQVLLTRLPAAPIPQGSLDDFQKTRAVQFIQHPTNSTGLAYTTIRPGINTDVKAFSEDLKLYPTPIPSIKSTDAYFEYVRNLYEIYKDLGDFKNYGIGSIGLIRYGVSQEQSLKLHDAFQLIREALNTYIETENDEITVFELEEVLNVMNCLYFSFFLESGNEQTYVKAVKDWVNIADPKPDSELTEDIFNQEKPYEHPLFWKFIQKLVTRGLVEQASAALEGSGIIKFYKTRDSSVYDILVDLKELIQTYPVGSSLDFFRSWKNLTLQAFENSKRLTSSELVLSIQSTLQILTGSKPHILNVCETWYESYLCLLLYHHPSPSLQSEYLKIIAEQHTPNVNFIWELTTHAILQGEILQSLQSISSFDPTTASYVSVVLEAKGLLNAYTDFTTVNLDSDLFSSQENRISEYFINQHALSCLAQPELFSLGIGLLSLSSNSYARQVIAEALPKYDFQTDDDLEWALTVCASLRLPETARTLYRIAGQRALADSRVYDSLVLFSKAGDVHYVKKYGLLLMERCLVSQGAEQDEFINDLVNNNSGIESGLIRQVLSPYVILTQYFSFLKSGDVRPAMTKLLRLLSFKFIPTEYVSLLLIELLKILIVYQRSVMTKGETFQLITALDEYEQTLATDSKAHDIAQRYYEIAKKFSAKEDAEYGWAEQFERIGVPVPDQVEGIVVSVRGVVAGVLAKLFLEDKKE